MKALANQPRLVTAAAAPLPPPRVVADGAARAPRDVRPRWPRQRCATLATGVLRRGGLEEALSRRGWRVSTCAGRPTAALLASADPADVVVLELRAASGDETLAVAEAYRAAGGRGEVVLVSTDDTEAQRRWAASVTPYWYRAPVSAATLASFLDRVAERRDAAAAAPPLEPRQREVTIRLGESVEVDGRPVYLGAAERNFLFTLAVAPGRTVSKIEEIEAGPGRLVDAQECRRRLGRRLTPELADLLVPNVRGEPYRMREPREVELTCFDAPSRHPPTRLRVVGRASVRTVYSDRLA